MPRKTDIPTGPSLAPDVQDQGTLLSLVLQSFASDVTAFSGLSFRDVIVDSNSCLAIQDLNGQNLFREYAIRSASGEKLGIVRSSARGAELPLIDCIFLGKALFEPEEAQRKVLALAGAENPGAIVSLGGFVCYGYPRVGIEVSVARDANVSKAIYDAHTYHLVKSWPAKVPAVIPDFGQEGEVIYSYSSLLPEAGNPAIQQQWGNYLRLAQRISTSRGLPVMSQLSRLLHAIGKTTGANMPEPEESPAMQGCILPTRLIPQETPVYCAVASGKMLLGYLGESELTQQEIAAAFKTGTSGTTNDDMVMGMNALAEGWNAAVSFDGTYQNATHLLSRMIPVKSGIPGHARVLRGWREYIFLDRKTGAATFTDRYFLINDPYPTGAGQVVLENVSKPIDDFYRNFLYVSRNVITAQGQIGTPFHL